MASFAGEASSSSSPPASTSLRPPRSCTYHVFLSFRGEDTRKGFTDHLHAALERKGIKTFRDDRYLETGEVISVELLKAIEESMFAITVLSPKYASSSWCLEELRHIVECSKSIGLEVVPVFYGVEPSDVRYQKGSFQQAFEKHEERFGKDSERIRKWKDALEQVANLSGWDSKDQHEAPLVECIAQHIHKRMIPKLPSSTKNLVGIDSKVEEVISHIGIGLNDVRSLGIWGMGGIGKTTIARVVYEAIRSEFKVSCFLANVREECERKNIVELQKQLVAHANIGPCAFYNEYDGCMIIQSSFCNKKVLLVLDDISDEDQLQNLVGEQDWFGFGSRIIITTKDLQLLKMHEVDRIYEVQVLDKSESFDLFCLKAFKQKNPKEGYVDLSEEVVKYSGGLPLALEVLGSYLFRKSIDVWHSAIEKMKSIPHAKIYDRLKISYEGLDSMEKDIFLHMACFFKGMNIYHVIDVLKKCGYSVEIGISVLIDRSLVTINQEYNVLDMHDLLQDMGKSIVFQESPDDPGRRSKLWSYKDIDLVLTNDQGTEKIQSIVFSGFDFDYEIQCSARAFSNMTQLKLLIMETPVFFPGHNLPQKTYVPKLIFPNGLTCLPTSLKVLRCPCFPLKTPPFADNQQYQLVEIKLQHSHIEHWHGKKLLRNLKFLDLSGSKNLVETPDLSGAPVLEILLLIRCRSLKEVHPSVSHHKNLIWLDLTDCERIVALPDKLEMSSLTELLLDGCSHLEDLPEFGECMKNLSRLSVRHTNIRKLPTSLGCLVGLKWLNLEGCKSLECFPDITDGLKSLKISGADEHINLPSLTTLNLSFCGLGLAEEAMFLPDFAQFPSLMDLDLSGHNFVSIPTSVLQLPRLRCLKLNYCSNLQCLPELPSTIRELEACRCCSVDISDFNALSHHICNFFVSPNQDPGCVSLEMLICGSKIPSWFAHQKDSNSVSISYDDYPLNGSLGIALCFQIEIIDLFHDMSIEQHYEIGLVVYGNNNRVIANRKTCVPVKGRVSYHYIICLTSEYFSDGFHRDTHFGLTIHDKNPWPETSVTSSARWVSIEDIENLSKSE